MRVALRTVLVCACLLQLAAIANADSFRISYTIGNLLPPNPCYSEGTLVCGSSAWDQSFLNVLVVDQIVQTHPGPPDLAVGSSSTNSFLIDLLPNPDGTVVSVSFGGRLVWTHPGPPNGPLTQQVFGFSPSFDVPTDPPSGAPAIEMWSLVWAQPGPPDIAQLGPPELSLYAYSSPGTQVGTLSLSIETVPEPGSSLLLGTGLGVLALVGWRRKKV